MNRDHPGFFSLFAGIFLCLFWTVNVLSDERKTIQSKGKDGCLQAKEKYSEGVGSMNYHERRAAFQLAVDLCPSYAEAHVNLADALEQLGLMSKQNFNGVKEGNRLLDLATRHYKRALEINPDIVAARVGLADVYMVQGRFPLAAENYRTAIKSRPDFFGLEARLRDAETRIQSPPTGVRKAEQITMTARESNMDKMYKTMGFESYVIKDTDRQSFDNILFEGWSSAIRPGEPITQLNEIGKALSSKDLESFRFIIEGHANAVGESDRNMQLSNDRAEAVKDYLIKNFSIDPDRLITQGFGFTRPKHTPSTDAQNRRVEIVFFREEGQK